MAFDNFMTDPVWIERARDFLDGIDLDPASNVIAQEYVKARNFCVAPEEYDSSISNMCKDGLKTLWYDGTVWCNPPYSRGLIDKFSTRMIDEFEWGHFNEGLMLVNTANDTKWYQDLLKKSGAVLLVRGRIKFWKMENGKALEKWESEKSKKEGKGKISNHPRYVNSLFYFGYNRNGFRDYFSPHGTVLYPQR